VTTDHAAPVFLKELAPAVYASLLLRAPVPATGGSAARKGDHSGTRRHTNSTGGGGWAGALGFGDGAGRAEPSLRERLARASAPVYRLYSHPLPKTNLANQVTHHLSRPYLGPYLCRPLSRGSI